MKKDLEIEEEKSESIFAALFEIELCKLVNEHVKNGLSKPDLIHKMKYVLKSCEMS